MEPLALNITLCQVMVSLSQGQELYRETDGDWLTPLKIFVRDTLGSGVKLNYRHLHMLLGTVWKMVLSQRSKCKSDVLENAVPGLLHVKRTFVSSHVAVTEDLLAAVYVHYRQKHLTLQARSLLLSFYSKLYLQEQGHIHIAR